MNDSTGPGANVAAWNTYISMVEEAKSIALNSRWGQSPRNRAQALYFISMLQAYGFNTYMGPRQTYPTFFSHHFYTPVEYTWGSPCPDFRYHWTAIDGERNYRIWGSRGTTKWLDIQAQRGWWGDADQSNLGNWDVDEFELGPSGEFEIFASATPQPKNWIALDAKARNICLLVRDVWDDWENDIGADIHIELMDPRPTDSLFLEEDEIGVRLEKIGYQTRFSVQTFLAYIDKIYEEAGGFNRFWAPPSDPGLGFNPKAVYFLAVYEIQPDEALIVETEVPNARYWSLQLGDNFMQTTDYRFHQSSLNNNQTRRDTDGKARLVLAGRDPGVPNWVDTAGLQQGFMQWRWYLSDRFPAPETRKVRIDELRNHLPADTPIVSPQQRITDLDRRRAQVGRRFKV
jgi:hypothetical protein